MPIFSDNAHASFASGIDLFSECIEGAGIHLQPLYKPVIILSEFKLFRMLLSNVSEGPQSVKDVRISLASEMINSWQTKLVGYTPFMSP